MPNATVSPELHHYDLKSLEGAWVKLRQLPYHDMLVRRDKGSIASMEQQQTTKKRGEPVNTKFILESLQTWEQDYMFKNCIAEHNLEDDKGELLNFNNPFAFKNLRPDIGLEIEQLISDLNQGESVDKDFQTAPLSSSEPPEAGTTDLSQYGYSDELIEEVAIWLSIYRLCRVLRCLPYPGALLDQPKGAIEKLEACMEANDRFEEELTKRDKPK